MLPSHRAEAFSRAFGPKALVSVSRPTLVWEVWAGPGSSVSKSEMILDGQRVPSRYDAEGHCLKYTPEVPLASGPHTVTAEVTIDGSLPVKRDWQFSVPNSAPESVPVADAQQRALVDAINRLREAMDLPDFVSDDRLAAAAAAHTEYLKTNNVTGHVERPGTARFVGAMPLDRLESYGFMEDSWECVDYGGVNQDEGLRDLFAAPYHRIPFMQPGSLLCGGSFDSRHLTVEFEMAKQKAVVVSPYPDEVGVPTSWFSHERPNPLRMHDVDRPVGYPIVFNSFTTDNQKFILKKARLKTSNGDEVPVFLNSSANDDKLTFTAFLIPQQPLQANTSYTVEVSGYMESGQNVSKTWSFTTGASR